MNTLSEKGTEKIKEGYGGVRLEAMVNLNRLFDDRVTDPRLEVNLMGGAEAGFVAHRGATYARKVRPFTGPTLGGQLVYAVNDHIGVFGQARWSKQLYAKFLARNEQQTPHAEPEHQKWGCSTEDAKNVLPVTNTCLNPITLYRSAWEQITRCVPETSS